MASCPRLRPTTLLQAGHSSLPQRSYAGGPFYFAATALRRRNYSTLRHRKLVSDGNRWCGGAGATPGAFYLGLCRLRGVLSPPALHDFAAGGPFFAAATAAAGGTVLLCDKDLTQAELFYFAATKIGIGRRTLLRRGQAPLRRLCLRIMPPSWHPVPACTPTTALQAGRSLLPQRWCCSDS